MSWLKITMTAQETVERHHEALQDAFEEVFMATGGPKNAAMFGGVLLADEFEYYFSPEAARIFQVQLSKFGANSCQAPFREDVSLLVGHSDARDQLLANKPA